MNAIAASGKTTQAPRAEDPYQTMLTLPLRALVSGRAPLTIGPDTSIQLAAQQMRQAKVTSVLLVDDDRLVGIATDRDLRNRVVAEALPVDRPIREIATANPWRVDLRASAFDALLAMTRHQVHHLPVVDGERVAGIVTAGDLGRRQNASAVVIAGEIHAQTDVPGLRQAASRVRELQRTLAHADASAHATGQIITAITDALTKRLLQMAEATLGAPPVPFAWVAAGSQGRCEQTVKSDQDNAMILDDAYDESAHGAYFKALSEFVCGGLNACGYIYCPGEMMAQNPKWRMTRSRWMSTLRHWIDVPEPMALMLTCVFFDMRLVEGQASLVSDVMGVARERAPGNGIFLAHMARNALTHRPPLNVFGRISTQRKSGRGHTVDLKHTGSVPIIDLARTYALAGGHATVVNTHDRLEIAASSKEISEQSARDLSHALEFLAGLRIRHQVRQMEADEAPDNDLRLADLSNFERTQLTDAFRVVKDLQEILQSRYA
jgi:CBS domain-containing protein